MASKRAFSEEDFSCPVCMDIFKDPVVLSCGHSVCKVCVRQYWSTKGSQECPLCRKRSFRSPPANLALKTLSESFQAVRGHPETRCDLHDEELKLYCVNDSQLACVVCRDSQTHLEHKFRPIDEIAAEHKDIVEGALKTATVKIKSLHNAQLKCQGRIDHIKQQAQHIRNQIKEEFKKLHDFLQEENTAMMTALRAEEKLKTQWLEVAIKNIDEELRTLSRTITETRKELNSKNTTFLKNFEKTLEKAQCSQSAPEDAFPEVVNVAKYLGNLQYRVWRKMQNIVNFSPVILDPNTAHSELILSTDLTSMRDSDEETKNQELLDIPERFNRSLCVLGSKGFSSGKHSWDIDVGNNTFWMVGVTTESVRRKEHSVFPSGAWGIGYDNEQLCARSPVKAYHPLPVAAKLQVVRILLDMNAGEHV
ncbi:zinc-binding protein A33-like [Salminus brasiliensis]|uniref:zinc-binding protein A33-like n=1 Tax=Salminus brasiliensis TaxID=930266 RepID=UPI003B82DF4E